MSIQEFICKYQEAFGKNTPLPIAFGYHHKAAEEVKKIPRCMIGAIRKVCDGKSLTLSADNVLCGGGSLYTAFAPMPDRVPVFVSEVEHYKQNQEQVKAYINRLDIRLTKKPYLNFIRIDQLESLEEMEGILFFATPDVLSGLHPVCFRLLQHRDFRYKRKCSRRPSLLHRYARSFGASVSSQERTDIHHTDVQV